MHQRIRKICLRILQFGLPLVFLSPLVAGTLTSFPFVVGKVWLFQIIVELLLPFFLILAILSPEHRPKKKPLLIAIGMYLFFLFLAMIFGVDPHRSFWANHERMTGVYALLHYGAFFLMASSVYRTRREWIMVFGVSVALSSVMVGLALWERAHDGFLASPSTGRVWGTLGNYIYLANYLLFQLYFLVMIFFTRGRNILWRIPLVVLGLLQILVIFYTETRGTLLAIFITTVLLLVWIGLREQRLRKAAVGLVIALFFMAGAFIVYRDTVFVQQIPGVGRLVRTTLSQGGGIRTRFIAWEIALQAIKTRPILGLGPENYYYAFNKFYNPESLRYSEYETWFDRPHNTILEVFSTTGILGGLAYLSIFIAAFWTIERLIRAGTLKRWEGLLAGGMLTAYVFQNFTVFDSHTSFLYFYFLIAFIAGIKKEAPQIESESSEKPVAPALITGGVSLLVILLLVVTTNVQPYRANAAGLIGTSYFRLRGDVESGMAAYDDSIALSRLFRRDLRLDGAREVLKVIASGRLPQEQQQRAIQWAVDLLKENQLERPLDIFDGLMLSSIYMSLAEVDSAYIEAAEKELEVIRPLSPKRQQIIYALAKVYIVSGRPQEAVVLLEESREQEALAPDTHWFLTLAHHQVGDMDAASQSLQVAVDLDYSWQSPDQLLLAIQIFKNTGEYDRAITLSEDLIELYPNEADPHLILADLLIEKGEVDRAREEISTAIQLNPEIIGEAQKLLREISTTTEN